MTRRERLEARIEKRRQWAEKRRQEAQQRYATANELYVRVTFPEKPSRDTLDALREAGFRWSGGSWCGRRDALPACVAELQETAP